MFYVYVIFRPDGSPCYVGKGKGGRWRDHARGSHNYALSEIYRDAGGSLPIVKVSDGVSETDAFASEYELISAIGRAVDGGPLVNIQPGGSGWRPQASDIEREVYNDLLNGLEWVNRGRFVSHTPLMNLYKKGTLGRGSHYACRRFEEDWRTSSDAFSTIKRIDAANRLELSRRSIGLKSSILVIMSVIYSMTWTQIGDVMGFSDKTAIDQTITGIDKLTSFYHDIFVT